MTTALPTETDDARPANGPPPVFVHFFDWPIDNKTLVDPIDWKKLDLDDVSVGSEEFYAKQFKFIRSIGVDALAWEFHPQVGQEILRPSLAAVAALAKEDLRVTPFYDLEISFRVHYRPKDKPLPILANQGMIRANEQTVALMSDELRQFFERVPPALIARDQKNRVPIFVFGYGFDDSAPEPRRWSEFARTLVAEVQRLTNAPPVFYWTSTNSLFEEYLFLHHRESFVPFQFVSDTPQAQYGHDAVTWNFGFDNLGVFRRDGLQRVIRLDPRYITEAGWLSAATDPALVFIYGWNEPFEGSMLMPTKKWGTTKADLARHYVRRLKSPTNERLPKTLLIVDDMKDLFGRRKNDWHLTILREMLHYSMRRFAPQAEVRMVSEVTAALLLPYDIIIDVSSEKQERVSTMLLATRSTRRLMVFDPLAAVNGGKESAPFISRLTQQSLNGNVPLENGDVLFARDDVYLGEPCRTCGVKLRAKLADGDAPLVITNNDDVWVGAYPGNETVMKTAFAALYGRPMAKSILYGEGMAAQRLEIDPKTRAVTYNRLSRSSVNLQWPLPPDINWFVLPDDVDEKHFRFIFGLDE